MLYKLGHTACDLFEFGIFHLAQRPLEPSRLLHVYLIKYLGAFICWGCFRVLTITSKPTVNTHHVQVFVET